MSSSYLSAEDGRVTGFLKSMAEYWPGQRAPTRSHLTLLTEVFDMLGAKKLGQYLVVDEAHAIKNTSGRTCTAVAQLRSLFTTCLMLTGTPVDNTWMDSFALLSLIDGHPITSPTRIRLGCVSDSQRRLHRGHLVENGLGESIPHGLRR